MDWTFITRIINVLIGLSTLVTFSWGLGSYATDMKNDVALLKSQMEMVQREVSEIRVLFEPHKP
jgi:hypothetical protein